MQLYPKATPRLLVTKFFETYASWDWEAQPMTVTLDSGLVPQYKIHPLVRDSKQSFLLDKFKLMSLYQLDPQEIEPSFV
jgi:hypothetical protein